ncbi:hypothetical protein [Paenibacillus gorillae]|uniref:hypothetical protein n=1 Tax=Paenibacillus gorillae TaxID=1243662 RepID=UPI0004ADD7C6|nr:hypothetical protein [Paenibacillus gorillae]
MITVVAIDRTAPASSAESGLRMTFVPIRLLFAALHPSLAFFGLASMADQNDNWLAQQPFGIRGLHSRAAVQLSKPAEQRCQSLISWKMLNIHHQ